jgi:dolichyl-phosphate-mannose-protein mannosyltransferase
METNFAIIKSWLAKNWILAALIAGAVVTRFPDLAYPRAIVFDEVYFLKQFAPAYFSHQYYFDIHPPLGKLLIAGWLRLMHVHVADSAAAAPWTVRLFIACFGIAIVPLVYGITRHLSGSKLAAGLAGLLILLNGAFIVDSRLVLMDSMLVCFGLGSLYAILRWQEKRTFGWLLACGLLAGACISIKWTGLTMFSLVLLLIFYTGWQQTRSRLPKGSYPIGKTTGRVLVVLFIAASVYLGSFWLHFGLLTKSGPGDAFMPADFRQSLVGDPAFEPGAHLSFWKKFTELNKEMYDANATLKASAPYGSKWYSWPLETRPVYFWQGAAYANGAQGNIYLMSNPVTWWLSSLSVVAAIVILLIPKLRAAYRNQRFVLFFLLIAYFINWLPFAKISRVMFLYHYLFAVIFSTMILAVLIGCMPADQKQLRRLRMQIAEGVAAIAVIGFLIYAPDNYGLPISPGLLHALTIIPGWR